MYYVGLDAMLVHLTSICTSGSKKKSSVCHLLPLLISCLAYSSSVQIETIFSFETSDDF
jgi:hypothetical protein